MISFEELTHSVHQRATGYSSCSPEQSLVYACEDIVDEVVGCQNITSENAKLWLEKICEREDIDVPHLHIGKSSQTVRASSQAEVNAMCIRGSSTSASTVLHELAHLMSDGKSHGVYFRDEFVRLTRTYISVDYAALLHRLYFSSGLEVSPWPASARPR